jgi:hypothetical protein
LKIQSRALLEDTDEPVVETLGACPHNPSVSMHLNRKTLNKGEVKRKKDALDNNNKSFIST